MDGTDAHCDKSMVSIIISDSNFVFTLRQTVTRLIICTSSARILICAFISVLNLRPFFFIFFLEKSKLICGLPYICLRLFTSI